MTARSLASALSLGVILSAGCAPSPANQDEPETTAAASSATIPVVTPDEVRALVEQRAGRVVVVNFWATWCPPCRTEFPDIIAVHKDYHEAGLEVIGVSTNEEDETEDIERFVREFAPPFPIYRAALDETFYQKMTDQWFGELPVTLVFDSDGSQVHFYKKPVTYDELAGAVSALLDDRKH